MKIFLFIYSENHSTVIPHTYTSQQISAVLDYIIGKCGTAENCWHTHPAHIAADSLVY